MNWKVIIPYAIAIGFGIYILVGAFGSYNKYKDKYFDLLMKDKDDRIEELRAERDKVEKKYNDALAQSEKKDSLLAIKSKVNTIRYEAVPSVVNAIPDNELLRKLRERYPDSDPN